MNRQEVYRLIDTEREYQDTRWNRSNITHKHSPEEWFTYMIDYINEAQHILSREDFKTCNIKAMDIMRKVGAMAVAAMEENETPSRVIIEKNV